MAEDNADIYRQRAVDMKAQAQRAETVYLQAIYSSIADNWDRLAAQMQAADRAGKKDHATENWEKLAQRDQDEPVDEAPPPNLAQDLLAQDKAVTGRL